MQRGDHDHESLEPHADVHKIETTKINHGDVRHHLNQKSCGLITLQLIIIQ